MGLVFLVLVVVGEYRLVISYNLGFCCVRFIRILLVNGSYVVKFLW